MNSIAKDNDLSWLLYKLHLNWLTMKETSELLTKFYTKTADLESQKELSAMSSIRCGVKIHKNNTRWYDDERLISSFMNFVDAYMKSIDVNYSIEHIHGSSKFKLSLSDDDYVKLLVMVQ